MKKIVLLLIVVLMVTGCLSKENKIEDNNNLIVTESNENLSDQDILKYCEDVEKDVSKKVNDNIQLVFLIVYFNYKTKPKFPYIIECKKIDCQENTAKKILDDHRFSEDQLTKEVLDDIIYQVEKKYTH